MKNQEINSLCGFWPKKFGGTPKNSQFSPEVGSVRFPQTCLQPLETKVINILASNLAFRLNRHSFKIKFEKNVDFRNFITLRRKVPFSKLGF